jgi:hypothetical protein
MEEPSQSVTVIEKPFCQKHVLTLRRHAAKNSSDFLRIIDSISVFPEESLASYQTRGISRSRVHGGLRLIYNELKRASTENASASHGVPEDKRVALLSSLDEKYKLQKQVGDRLFSLKVAG